MSDQSDAAQKILQLACEGPLRLADVIAEIAPIVQERDAARAERDKERIERTLTWQKLVDDHRNNALATLASLTKSEASPEPRQLRPDELAVADPSRTVADIARTQFDRADQ